MICYRFVLIFGRMRSPFVATWTSATMCQWGCGCCCPYCLHFESVAAVFVYTFCRVWVLATLVKNHNKSFTNSNKSHFLNLSWFVIDLFWFLAACGHLLWRHEHQQRCDHRRDLALQSPYFAPQKDKSHHQHPLVFFLSTRMHGKNEKTENRKTQARWLIKSNIRTPSGMRMLLLVVSP